LPDWLTYVISAWVLCELLALAGRSGARRYVGVVALGSVLPDIVKPFFLLKTLSGPDLIAFSIPFATPIGAVLVATLLSRFFQRKKERTVLIFMLAGAGIHLAWDLMLHPYGGGTLLFFPLSFQQYALGLIWPDSILPLAVIGGFACVLVAARAVSAAGSPRRRGGL
jgi:hypothetical protein